MFRKVVSLLTAVTVSWGTQALSAPLSVLVAERAEIEHGYEMPVSGSFEISYFNYNDFDTQVIYDFYYEKATGKFIAVAIDENGNNVKVAGLALLVVDVPVPNKRIMPEELVTEADITVAKLPFARVGSFAIMDKQSLIGMQARRMLAQGRPVPEQSVTPPIIVKKGSKVEIRYSDGAMKLSAPGKALYDGYKGQEVKVVNLVSNKHVVGTATREGIVEIFGD